MKIKRFLIEFTMKQNPSLIYICLINKRPVNDVTNCSYVGFLQSF